MKFTVNSDELKKNLAQISGAVATNNTTPILSCIYMEIEGNELLARTTNMSITIAVRIPVIDADVSDGNKIAIPAALFLNALKAIGGSAITIHADTKTWSVSIKTESGNYNISGRDASLFPSMVHLEDTDAISIPTASLINALDSVAFAASTDPAHIQLSGILFDFLENGINIVATDGHKMSQYSNTELIPAFQKKSIMPASSAKTIKNVLTATSDNNVHIYTTPTYMEIRVGNVIYNVRLIDGNYPRYNSVFPQGDHFTLGVDKKHMSATVTRVLLFANQITSQIALSIKDNTLTVSAEDIEFANKAQETIPCSWDGGEFRIGFNGKLLQSIMSAVRGNDMEIQLTEPKRPAVITSKDGYTDTEKVQMLLMPVVLTD